MARSEKAERTYQLIIDASVKLFFEKGYEKTSIQDILDEVKMSRGVVYYYFKSKKEILDAIQAQRLDALHPLIKGIQAENAKNKITEVLSILIGYVGNIPEDDTRAEKSLALEYLKDPHMILSNMQAHKTDAKLIVDLFEEGILDGSIQTEYPLQMAELLMMLISTWLNPIVFNRSLEQTETHFKFIQQMFSKLGADVLSDEVIDKLVENWKQLGYFDL